MNEPSQREGGSDIAVRPLGGALGACIDDIDLSRDLDDGTMRFLRDLFLQHLVLVFPGQAHLTAAQLVDFASHWGQLHRLPEGTPYLEDHPEVLVLDFHGRKPPTDVWHSDKSMDEFPPLGSFLLARVIPVGGDTIFANQYLAYETLSDGMKKMLARVRALHTGDNYAKDGTVDPSKLPRNLHPVVRTHPETGRKALFVNPVFTQQFEGMTAEESAPLLRWLFDHSVAPNLTFIHRWTVGDLVFWDNRCVQHFAIADYGASPRTMHRVTVLGDRPK